jgi:5-methylthioribose kinase
MLRGTEYDTGMLELGPDNAEIYLRERRRIAGGPVRVTELADGVSNVVLCVETPSGKFVLKQSRPKLRTKEHWFSDLSRIWRERDAMRFLGGLLPSGVVPEVLWSDEENFALAMSHAPEPFRNWRTVLLAGEVDAALGQRAGQLLGTIHENSSRDSGRPQPFADRTVFEQLRVDPFYVRVSERLPDVADTVAPLIERCRTERLGLCHGDFSPKNLLLHKRRFTLVDYETCHCGDITFDVGFFLSHLLLKAIFRCSEREQFLQLTQAFWLGYQETKSSPLPAELFAASVGHLGACLLARVDGTSPAPYLADEKQRQAVRKLGRRLLDERPPDWETVIKLLAADPAD